jgi:REP element-mobilizing transposase RayT
MPEHMHIVACARKNGSNVLTFVDRFKGKSTTLWWNMGCHGKLWQPRSYDHLVRREESLLVIVKYVLDNPVRRGLAERWEDYGWCGLLDPMPLG